MKNDQIVVYPVILTRDANEPHPYLVEIPALDGMTEGDSLADALAMAEDYIGTFSLENPMPASIVDTPPHKPEQIVSFMRVNVSEYQRRNDTRAVKKTLTIPNYLNELGTERGVNFSAILAGALRKELDVK